MRTIHAPQPRIIHGKEALRLYARRGGARDGARGRSGKGGALASVFDPATLAWKVWSRGSFVGPTWPGTVSAGTSGAVTLLDSAGTVPGPGTTVNGFAPMACPGSDWLYGPNSNAVWATSAATMIVICKPTVAPANDPNAVNLPGIIGVDGVGSFQCAFSDAGYRASAYDGIDYRETTIAAANNAWHVFASRIDGSTIQSSVDGSAFTSVAPAGRAIVGTLSLPAATVHVGSNYTNVAFTGDLMEVLLGDFVITQGQLDGFYASYAKTRYPAMGLA